MDILSDILRSVRMHAFVHTRNEFSAPWGFRVDGRLDGVPEPAASPRRSPCNPDIGFYLITHGQCWLRLDDHEQAVPLASGDLVLFPQGRRSYQLQDAPDSPVRPVREVVQGEHWRQRGHVRHGGGGARTTFVCGGLFLEDPEHDQVLGTLPPLIKISMDECRLVPWLDGLPRALDYEIASFGPGTQAVVDHLMQAMLAHALRVHVMKSPPASGNWLRAALDTQIGPALTGMHARPEAPWTVETLAKSVSMSRSVFAARFTALLGQTPIEYLTNLRMTQAAALLRAGASVKEAAAKVGYQSETTFSAAFKRRYGMAPAAYGKGE